MQHSLLNPFSQNVGTGRASDSTSWKMTGHENDVPLMQATSIVRAEEVLSGLRDMKRVVVDNYGFIHQTLPRDPSIVKEVTSLGRGASRAPAVSSAGVLELRAENPATVAAARASRQLLALGRSIPSNLLHSLKVPNLKWGLERALVMTVG